MTSLSKNIGPIPVNISDIFNVISEEDILAYYFNVYKVPCLISSPLREDKNPSFAIYYKGDKIKCYDFGTKESFNVLSLLMEYNHLDFQSILRKIWKEMCFIQTNVPKHINKTKRIKYSSDVKLKVKTRSFKDYDLEYWNNYGINQEWLRFGRVFAISDIVIIKDKTQTNISAAKYAYAFIEFKDDKQTIKIYQPFNTNYKWMSDNDSSVWNLWSQLPEVGNRLIITSSVKDALCLWANTGIPCTCLQSESTIPKDKVVKELIKRFNTIYVFFDNDCNKLVNTGQTRAKKLCEKYHFKNLCIDDWYQCKDPSDLYKQYGKTKFIQIIKNMLCI